MGTRKLNYKPLLFTTTVRNPERMKRLLYVLKDFDNQILTQDTAKRIIGDLIKFGLYRPMKKSTAIKEKWSTTKLGEFSELILNQEEVEFMLENNPQNHKEAGFEKGWPSRFETYFGFAKEFGFAYYKSNEKIKFSEIGLSLANTINVEILDNNIFVESINPEFEQQAFLNALAKYQRKSPFSRVLNDNVPLILLLQTIKKLNDDKDYNGAGISKLELPLLLYWKNGDSDSLYRKIKEIREEHSYSPSWEVILDICRNEIMFGEDITREDKSIMIEYPDDFIRKMRLTGLISLRGAGRFIDINTNEIAKVEYVLETYATYQAYDNEQEYFNYLSGTDNNFLNVEAKSLSVDQTDVLFHKWIKHYSWETIKKELVLLSDRKASKDSVLKLLTHPIKLEFLTSLAIKSRFPKVKVIPNYPTDDEGIPTSTAGGQGNQGDIECFEDKNGILVEVTMSGGRAQTMMEVWPITRHLEEFSKKIENLSMCYFIAPNIYIDSARQIEYVQEKEGLKIIPKSIPEFIEHLELEEMLYVN